MKQLLLFLCIIVCFNSFSRDKKKSENGLRDTISLIIKKVEAAIDQDWFLIQNDSGFTAYYCRTCQQKYIDWKNEVYQKNKVSDFYFFDTLLRQDFFTSKGPDSVAFYTNVNMVRSYAVGEDRRKEILAKYKKDDILKIDVYFQNLWSKDKLSKLQQLNDSLRPCVENNSRRINYTAFADYRHYTPNEQARYTDCANGRTFYRLPYHSSYYNYSIFIDHNPPCFFCQVMFVDDTDSTYYEKTENKLDGEIDRTLKFLALSLGINDFKLLHEYRIVSDSKKRKHRKFYSE